ncbi:hypothetical protein [Roseicyclus marinus]|uniref:hypothetical protein n=1 Tax=Roseicyclus marinus TaxID=2161673 RepID=UPI0024102FDD|nr:hypothetical protein [Roseicyclus marinus]MDG3042789.1 hypothetical protein [Roseicyclus marinus]
MLANTSSGHPANSKHDLVSAQNARCFRHVINSAGLTKAHLGTCRNHTQVKKPLMYQIVYIVGVIIIVVALLGFVSLR